MIEVLAPFAAGYLLIFAVIIGVISIRQTDKMMEFLSFFFFSIVFGWALMGFAGLLGKLILKYMNLF